MYSLSVLNVEQNTTFFGITDLRTKAKKMLKALKASRVIITERNQPQAVVLDYGHYQKIEELVEMAEEALMAPEVKRRKKRNRGKFLSHEGLVERLSSE